MGLSNDLLSQFAKITNDKSKKKEETVVYGTAVEYSGSIYVKLDGSDLVTPMKFTTDAKPGDRVRVTIKNHTATVTGNLSSPSARTDDLKEVAVNVTNLKTEKLSATDADIKYANIDFTNIGKAAMEYFYANSGLIKNVTVGDQTITGDLVGVTISGDLIKGNTIVAEKLVIKGDNGLYYKLNTDGMNVSKQDNTNSINGTIIQAKSITATKISVKDLVAFGATIGGFVITDDSIHSGVKDSADNTTRGVYLDNQGQIAFGDGTNFIKYYKDAEGNYRLAISAERITFGISDKTDVGTAIDDIQQKANAAIISSIEQFYQSDSPTSLSGGEWSIVEPVWKDGKYLWRRTKNTYGDGSTEYTPSENGVCITGADGEDAIVLTITASNGTVFKNNTGSTILTAHVYKGGVEQSITDSGVCGTLGSIKWYKGASTTAIKTAKTLTVSASDITNYEAYICQLEN